MSWGLISVLRAQLRWNPARRAVARDHLAAAWDAVVVPVAVPVVAVEEDSTVVDDVCEPFREFVQYQQEADVPRIDSTNAVRGRIRSSRGSFRDSDQ